MIYLVEDDPSIRVSVDRLLRSAGLDSTSFASASEFLGAPRNDEPNCLLLDVQLPDLNGHELQERLERSGHPMPVVFITGHATVLTAVKAMKAGAVDYLSKPVDAECLLVAVRKGLDRDARRRGTASLIEGPHRRLARLNPREREVLVLLAEGMLNKQIASDLRIAEKTVKVHRARIMEKREAGSFAELVRMAERVGISSRDTAAACRP